MPFEHGPVGRANLVREDDQCVPDGDPVERHVAQRSAGLPVGHGRHPAGEGRQHRRCLPDGVRLERLPAREHEHDQCPSQVFAEHDRRDDGDAGQEVGPELAAGYCPEQPDDERQPAQRESHDERCVPDGRRCARQPIRQEIPGNEVDRDAGHRKERYADLEPTRRGGRVCPTLYSCHQAILSRGETSRPASSAGGRIRCLI